MRRKWGRSQPSTPPAPAGTSIVIGGVNNSAVTVGDHNTVFTSGARNAAPGSTEYAIARLRDEVEAAAGGKVALDRVEALRAAAAVEPPDGKALMNLHAWFADHLDAVEPMVARLLAQLRVDTAPASSAAPAPAPETEDGPSGFPRHAGRPE